MMDISIGPVFGGIVAISIAIIGGIIRTIIISIKLENKVEFLENQLKDELKKIEEKSQKEFKLLKIGSSRDYLLDSIKKIKEEGSNQIKEILKITPVEDNFNCRLKELEKQINNFPKHYLHAEHGVCNFKFFQGKQCEIIQGDRWVRLTDKDGYNKLIKWKSDFIEKPIINIGINTLDSEHNTPRNLRIRSWIDNIDNETKSFNLNVETWEDSYIHEVEISWIVIGYTKYNP